MKTNLEHLLRKINADQRRDNWIVAVGMTLCAIALTAALWT